MSKKFIAFCALFAMIGALWADALESTQTTAQRFAPESTQATKSPESARALDSAPAPDSAKTLALDFAPAQESAKILVQDSTPNLAPDSTPKSTLPIYLQTRLGFDFFLDNLEGSGSLWDTRTLYAIRLAPEIGLSIAGEDSGHTLMFGGYTIQDMGFARFPSKANISAYYAYEGRRTRGIFGIFPRKMWIGKYPLSFFREDFLYYAPNTNGLALQFKTGENARVSASGELVFDWFGGNLAKRFDEFFILANTRLNVAKGAFFAQASGLMYHFKNEEILGRDGALTPEGLIDTNLMDKIHYELKLGSDMSAYVPWLERAEASVEMLGLSERKRRLSGLGDFYHGIGAQASLKLQYKGFGIEESYYFGKGQMRYFSEYGEGFYDGLPFYRASGFNRLCAYYEWQNSFLKARLSLLAYSPRGAPPLTALQQMLTISIDPSKLWQAKRLF
ncbi:hypothetical protein BKN38_02555 [Helicobacter sp. CLO-3]|uniref:hypothetical protein n=1 Tax=unclassified Helicobacter TaxID=2593540 RepID=UPI0008051FDD|nr:MULTISPECIES: hypothetical protein [unclassified Helicobacter]OBV29422.1 hypothetical protein BA723_00480 [Helicobacter sp. CLO-3]OHU84682.1 hypothetical protein BKN38_02555 [Helicobacter sp. CLO-3]